MRRLALVAALLAGCTTVGPDYERPAVPMPAAYPAAGGAGEAPIPEWWTLFRDPLLDHLVEATRHNNTDLRFAAARVLQAEAVLRETSAARYPEVDAGYAGARSRVSTRTEPPPVAPLERTQHQLIASTSYEIDFWGRVARANEAARASLAASRLSREVVALTLSSATAQAYFALRSLDAQVVALDGSVRTGADSLEIAQARLAAGLAPELDVHQARAALSDLRVQLIEARRQRALVEHQLGVLTGRMDLRIAPGDLFAMPLPPTPPPGLPAALLDRRPDIRAAEQTLVAANAQIGVARAALFPTISLTGALGAQSTELSTLLSTGAGIWAVGASLTLPIFDAGRRSARVEQAEAVREQALAQYVGSIESAFRETADALVNLDLAAQAEADIGQRLEAARAALELSGERYKSGYSPYLEVLDAQRTANDAELAFVRYRQLRLAFSVDLMKALGGGWQAIN
ncbi:MAG: efflux transporter outer membrane subunit [Burkholderiales bacterium]